MPRALDIQGKERQERELFLQLGLLCKGNEKAKKQGERKMTCEKNDWEAAMKEIAALSKKIEEEQKKAQNDAEVIAKLKERIIYLEGQIDAFRYCIANGGGERC